MLPVKIGVSQSLGTSDTYINEEERHSYLDTLAIARGRIHSKLMRSLVIVGLFKSQNLDVGGNNGPYAGDGISQPRRVVGLYHYVRRMARGGGVPYNIRDFY